MKPVPFKHQNTVFAEDQPEYQPLPALKLNTPEGEVISCWKLSFRERLRVLFLGRVWLSLFSFNQDLTPSYLAVNRTEVFSLPDDSTPVWVKLVNKVKRLFAPGYQSGYSYFAHHKPSGEDWFILGIDAAGNRVCAAGWPPSIGKLSDCSNLKKNKPLTEEELQYRNNHFGTNWI